MAISITPQELAAICQSGKSVELIDVRTQAEFRELHVDFARNVPIYKLDPKTIAAQRNGRASEPLYVICQSGSRGKPACDKLAAVGLNAINVEGGTLAWDAEQAAVAAITIHSIRR